MTEDDEFKYNLEELFAGLDDIARDGHYVATEFVPLVQVYYGKHIANLYGDWVMKTWEPDKEETNA